MVQNIFLVKRLEIILIERKGNKIIVHQVIEANLKDNFCFKLYHLLKMSYLMKEIDSCYFTNFLVYSKNYNYHFG